jgi:hypothetical protein
MEERVGQQAHLVGVGEEPGGEAVGDDRVQDQEAAKQRDGKNDEKGTALRERIGRGRRAGGEIEWGLLGHVIGRCRSDRAMVSDRNSPGPMGGSGRVVLRRQLKAEAYVVPLGMRRETVRSFPMSVKIWLRLLVGCEAEMQVLSLPLAV